MRRTTTRRALLVLLLALGAAQAAHADFRHARLGARPRALGSAFTALSDDPNAVFWNPAGLSRDDRTSLTLCRAWAYSAEGIRDDDLIVTSPDMCGLRVGLGIIRVGIDDLLYEDTYALAGAVRAPWLEGLSLGATGKVLRLAAPGYEVYGDPAYNGGDMDFAVDLGFHYDSGKAWTLGGVVQNLNEPYLQLLETTVDPDPVYSTIALGGSYLFRETLRVSGDVRSREGGWGDTTLHGGAEIWFFDALALRAGLAAGQVTMGFGLQDVRWQLDLALESVENVGNVYMLSFTVRD